MWKSRKRVGTLRKYQNVADLDKKGEVIQLQKGKCEREENWNFRIKKTKKEIEKGDLKDRPLIGRNPK